MVPFCTNGCSISLSKVLVNLSHQKSFICNKYLIVIANIKEFGILKKIHSRKKLLKWGKKKHIKWQQRKWCSQPVLSHGTSHHPFTNFTEGIWDGWEAVRVFCHKCNSLCETLECISRDDHTFLSLDSTSKLNPCTFKVCKSIQSESVLRGWVTRLAHKGRQMMVTVMLKLGE